MQRSAILVVLVGASLVPLGCRGQERTCAVSGTVQLDGQPLKEGEITFADTSGLVPATLAISDGKFQGQARAGSFRVEIRAYRLGQNVKAGPGFAGGPTRENFIPDRFNTNSTEMVEVTTRGPNQFDFQVQSQ